MPTITALTARVAADVADDTRALVARIREAEDPLALRDEGAAAVVRLTRIGLDAFFLEPVQAIGLGTMSLSMVRFGLRSAASAIGLFVRRIVGGLSAEQMLGLADRIDDMLLDLEIEAPEAR